MGYDETDMITRGDSEAGAVFSDCEKYRYRLWRGWEQGHGRCLFIMLNPSTATELVLDNTIRRCMGYAKDWGYAGIEICNLFAYRATKPADMKKQVHPIGLANNEILKAMAMVTDQEGGQIICAWGAEGKYLGRGLAVAEMLSEYPLYYLALNDDGSPKHPLYQPKDLQPSLWEIV